MNEFSPYHFRNLCEKNSYLPTGRQANKALKLTGKPKLTDRALNTLSAREGISDGVPEVLKLLFVYSGALVEKMARRERVRVKL